MSTFNGGDMEDAVGYTEANVVTHERHAIFPLVVVVIMRAGIKRKHFLQHLQVGIAEQNGKPAIQLYLKSFP